MAATDLSPGAVDFGEVDWKNGRHALVFGSEEVGISEELRELADVRVRLPMRGLAESLNPKRVGRGCSRARRRQGSAGARFDRGGAGLVAFAVVLAFRARGLRVLGGRA